MSGALAAANGWLQAALASGHLLDALLGLLVLELAALLAWQAFTGRGLPAARLLPNLLSGGLLMVALRLLQSGADAPWLLAALAGSGLAHWLDLRQRWPGRPQTQAAA